MSFRHNKKLISGNYMTYTQTQHMQQTLNGDPDLLDNHVARSYWKTYQIYQKSIKTYTCNTYTRTHTYVLPKFALYLNILNWKDRYCISLTCTNLWWQPQWTHYQVSDVSRSVLPWIRKLCQTCAPRELWWWASLSLRHFARGVGVGGARVCVAMTTTNFLRPAGKFLWWLIYTV